MGVEVIMKAFLLMGLGEELTNCIRKLLEFVMTINSGPTRRDHLRSRSQSTLTSSFIIAKPKYVCVCSGLTYKTC